MFRQLTQMMQGYSPVEILLELAVIWVCVYFIYRFLRGTRGAGVIKGFAVLIVVLTLLVRVLGHGTGAFERLNFIYDRFLALLAIVLIVVFQPELRQAMIRLGHAHLFGGSHSKHESVVDAVAGAVEFLSKSQFGALIALERQVQLGGLVEGGVEIDAQVSERLLESIFWPNSPLHDLGVVIRGDRIIGASVQFPLAEEGILPPELGSRHRAAVGLTMESDCLVVIVSEETGAVSIAEHGRLDRAIPRETLREVLSTRLGIRTPLPDDETVLLTSAEGPRLGRDDASAPTTLLKREAS